MNVNALVAELTGMTVTALKGRYGEVFGEPAMSGHKQFLIKRIVWRTQALREGGLSERARRRATELAEGAEIRLTAPPPRPAPGVTVTLPPSDARLPMAGSVLTREWRGRKYAVKVTPSGFEYEGQPFRSLTAVAKAITGSHWNGYLFFGIDKREGVKA